MNFHISGLPFTPFQPYFNMSGDELRARGAMIVIADDHTAPCRVSLAHAAMGEELLLVSYQHQDADSPYRAAGPIYVRKNAAEATLATNEVPEQIRCRMLSVRGYDRNDLMIEADVTDGAKIESLMNQFFLNDAVAYIHIHYARRGCYAARVDRV